MSAAGFGSQRARGRFQREVDLTARLEHPNIARVYDGGEIAGLCFYAMELIDGLPLDQHVQQQSLSRRQILELMKVICDAVQYAHQKGVIHRDLKPANILIDSAGQPRVLDFGLAKALLEHDDQNLSVDMATAGTPVYMSPEQAAGHLDQLDTRSDVYTLGVILFHLLSGKFPHDISGSAIEIMKRISETEPKRLKQIEPKVDTDLEALLSKALAREPERRYGTAGGLAADLHRYLHGEPLEAQPPTVAYLLRKKLRKYRAPLAIAASVFALLLATAIWAYVRVSKERNAALVANVEKDKQTRKALAQKREAEDQKANAQIQRQLAVKNEATAVANEVRAREQQRNAELRRADALVQQGNALGIAGRWMQARASYNEAFKTFAQLDVPTLAADAGLAKSYAQSPSPLLTLDAHEGPLYAVAVCPDGVTAVASGDKGLWVWDLKTGRKLQTLRGHTNRVWTVAVSPDGHSALSGSGDSTLRLWDLQTGDSKVLTGHSRNVDTVAFLPDGRTAISGGADSVLRVWDLAAGTQIKSFGTHEGDVRSIAVSPDGDRALSADSHGSVRLWDLKSGTMVRQFETRGGACYAVVFCKNGRQALTAQSDQCLKLWNLEDGMEIRKFTGHSDKVNSLAVLPDGNSAVSCCADGTVRIWDLETARETCRLNGHTAGVTAISTTIDGGKLVSSSVDGTLKLWAPQQNSEARQLNSLVGRAIASAFSADGTTILVANTDSAMRLWDSATGKQLRLLKGHARYINCIRFLPDGKTAVVGNNDATLSVWDLATGAESMVLKGHGGSVNGVDISSDGRRAVSASDDGTARLWDLHTGEVLHTYQRAVTRVHCVGLSSDGSTLVTGNESAEMTFWDVPSGREIRTIKHAGALNAVAFSPDAIHAAAGYVNSSSQLQLWDSRDLKPTALDGHTNRVCRNSVYFSADGRFLASGSEDKTFKLWDAQRGEEIQSFDHIQGLSTSVASNDFRFALCGFFDGAAELWDFRRPDGYREMEAAVRAAQDRLQENAQDPAALATLGRWYAFRGLNGWAVEFLEKARAGGIEIQPLTLGRCYWQLGQIPQAKINFEKASQAANDKSVAFYLQLCISAMK